MDGLKGWKKMQNHKTETERRGEEKLRTIEQVRMRYGPQL